MDRIRTRIAECFIIAIVCFSHSVAMASPILINTVPIADAGNAADPATGYGSVSYDFQMGQYEVTNYQYASFLNAVAPTDSTSSLVYIGTDPRIVRSGVNGDYHYSVQSGWEDKPARVNLIEAMRFANWLNNGQGGPGTTEYGAYTLLGNSPIPSNFGSITRNADATWWLPNEDEWYKAAYGVPGSGNYYLYPTGSNVAPVAEVPPGGSDSANYAAPLPYSYTDVGAYIDSASPFGTFDQGGNAQEWIEDETNSGLMRGGDTSDNASYLASTRRYFNVPIYESGGFRVATVAVPEPSSIALAAIGVLLGISYSLRTRFRTHAICGRQ